MRRAATTLLVLTLSLSSFASAGAATAKPTPKSTSKTTSKPATKSASKTSTSTKSVVKHTYTSRPRTITRPRPVSKPKPVVPVWPPKGFIPQNGIYAHIPSGSELVRQLTATSQLITECEKIACGAVYIASDTPCNYWVLGASVYGPDPTDVTKSIPYGTIRLLTGPTKARTIYPIILRSNEPMIPHEALILQTLNIKKDAFYKAIAQGKSLTQIAGSQVSVLVKAITQAELDSISSQESANTITADQASAMRAETPARIGVELTQYNLTLQSISMQCWTQDPTETVPSNTYTANPNHF